MSKRMPCHPAIVLVLLAAVCGSVQGADWLDYFHKVPGELMALDTPQPVRDDAAVACVRTERAPKLDGKLDDPIWQRVHFSGGFAHYFGYGIAKPATSFALCHDADALYLAVRCEEPDTDAIVTKTNKHDGPVYADDNIEVFLDPGAGRLNFYHLAVNAKGVRFDQFNSHAAWSKQWEAHTSIQRNKGWTIEARLPLASFRGKAAGEWGINLARTRPRGPGSMPTMWRCGFGFMKPPMLYGRIRFDGAGITLDRATIHNAAERRQTVAIRATLQPRGVGSIKPVEPIVKQFKVKLAAGAAIESKPLGALFTEGAARRDRYRRLIVEATVGGRPAARESWRWHTPPVTGQVVWSRVDDTHPRVEVRVFLHATGAKVRLTIALTDSDGAAVATATRSVAGGGEYEFTFPRPRKPGRYVLTLSAKGGKYEMPLEVVAGRMLR